MGAAVLRVRRLVVPRIEGELLAVAHRAQSIGADPERDEIRPRGAGPALTQRQIVLGGSALVAMTFDGDRPGGILLQYAGVLVERLLTLGGQLVAVEREKHRPQ